MLAKLIFCTAYNAHILRVSCVYEKYEKPDCTLNGIKPMGTLSISNGFVRMYVNESLNIVHCFKRLHKVGACVYNNYWL